MAGRDLTPPPDEEASRQAGLPSSEEPSWTEHQRVEDCTLIYQGHVAAPGYGVAYECEECGRPWLKLGSGYVDPRAQVYELSPEDVI
jgi:hypothetical protein